MPYISFAKPGAVAICQWLCFDVLAVFLTGIQDARPASPYDPFKGWSASVARLLPPPTIPAKPPPKKGTSNRIQQDRQDLTGQDLFLDTGRETARSTAPFQTARSTARLCSANGDDTRVAGQAESGQADATLRPVE